MGRSPAPVSYSPPRAKANGIGLFHKSARLHIPPPAREGERMRWNTN